MDSNFFLLSIRPFLYYALFIILFMVFIISILTNAPLQFIVFYIGLIAATLLRQLYLVTTRTDSSDSSILYNSYLLTLNVYSIRSSPALPLFVWAYTIAYMAYTSLMIKRVTLPQMYFVLFTMFYFICHLSYILIIYNNPKTYYPSVLFNILFGCGLGLFISYIIDRFIDYRLLLFSTYKGRITTLQCAAN